MKLKKDFGVRALLATIGAIGYYGSIGFVLARYPLSITEVVAILGMAQAPFLSIVAFYFATRNNPPTGSAGGT